MRQYKLWNFAAHACIVLGIVFLVFFVIDRINPYMNFLGSDQTDILILIFSLVSILNGVLTAVKLFKRNQSLALRAERREAEEERLYAQRRVERGEEGYAHQRRTEREAEEYPQRRRTDRSEAEERARRQAAQRRRTEREAEEGEDFDRRPTMTYKRK